MVVQKHWNETLLSAYLTCPWEWMNSNELVIGPLKKELTEKRVLMAANLLRRQLQIINNKHGLSDLFKGDKLSIIIISMVAAIKGNCCNEGAVCWYSVPRVCTNQAFCWWLFVFQLSWLHWIFSRIPWKKQLVESNTLKPWYIKKIKWFNYQVGLTILGHLWRFKHNMLWF